MFKTHHLNNFAVDECLDPGYSINSAHSIDKHLLFTPHLFQFILQLAVLLLYCFFYRLQAAHF